MPAGTLVEHLSTSLSRIIIPLLKQVSLPQCIIRRVLGGSIARVSKITNSWLLNSKHALIMPRGVAARGIR